MTSPASVARWSVRVNAEIARPVPRTAEAGRVAAMFGLADGRTETLYDDFALDVAPGEIVAVTGPSGAGKTVLLRAVGRQVPGARWLRTAELARASKSPVELLDGGSLAERLEVLARCGLAEAATLITRARHLSGGQVARLALAEALHAAMRSPRAPLVIADEFAAGLDPTTARLLCGRVRGLVAGSSVGLVAATPRSDLVRHLQPDRIIVKPLGGPARVISSPAGSARRQRSRFRVRRGTIHDYRELGGFHYLAGPPAAHKRVYVVRPPGRSRMPRWRRETLPAVAAVLVVSPPLPNVRGRNRATAGRYVGPDRTTALQMLNEEVETISRVIVHPIFRGCGLATRLVRHALATAETPLVEALAAMGRLHPFLQRAGMTPTPVPPSQAVARLLSAAEAVGLAPLELAAVGPAKALLARRSRRAAFLRAELERFIDAELTCDQLARLADPVSEACRRTARRYVYYLFDKTKPVVSRFGQGRDGRGREKAIY